jgi:hypothetical protein
MKKIKFMIIFLGVTTFLSAGPSILSGYYHPQGEPRGLYIVEFNYYGAEYQYRVYCPTSQVRNISGGSWGNSRSAHNEDRRYFNGERVLRSAINEVCR